MISVCYVKEIRKKFLLSIFGNKLSVPEWVNNIFRGSDGHRTVSLGVYNSSAAEKSVARTLYLLSTLTVSGSILVRFVAT